MICFHVRRRNRPCQVFTSLPQVDPLPTSTPRTLGGALVKGARLDSEPELLFTLRGVDHRELVPKIAGKSRRQKADAFADDELADVFGVDIAAAPAAKRSLAKPAPDLKKKPAPAKSKKSAPVAKAPKALPAKKAKAVSRR